MSGFERIFDKFLQDRRTGNTIVWDKIQPLLNDSVIPYSKVQPAPEGDARSLLDKMVVLKLNGGLGTTMGCVGPKSLISVYSDRTFLDLTVEQIEVCVCVRTCVCMWCTLLQQYLCIQHNYVHDVHIMHIVHIGSSSISLV